MIAYAKSTFHLERRQKDGATLREHMESVAQATGRRPDALNVPPCPDVAEHVWLWFLELHSGRQGGGMGPSPLAWSEIESWSRQMGTQPHAWEIEAIKALDMAWLRAQAEEG